MHSPRGAEKDRRWLATCPHHCSPSHSGTYTYVLSGHVLHLFTLGGGIFASMPQVYSREERAGMIVVITCGALSLIATLGMFLVLGISALRGRRSSGENLFVHTQVAMYFICLLLCNFTQGIGALFQISWIAQNRIEIGTACTAQAAVKHIGSVGSAIFTFVIAAYTFSILFYSRQWSNRTAYIVLAASWGLLVLDMCINPMVADPVGKGPYYGIVPNGYWCWITSGYPKEQFATQYLFVAVSALFSLILYLLVYFRLRGNITTEGYRVHVWGGRMNNGAYIMTSDYLVKVGRKMLWHPITYIALFIPMSIDRIYNLYGVSPPLPAIIIAAAVFMLSGFVNVVVFSMTRSVLPWSWRQRLGIRSTLSGRRGDNRIGAVGGGGAAVVLHVSMKTDIETKYDEAELSPQSPLSPLPVYGDGGRQRADTGLYHIRKPSFPASQDAGEALHVQHELDGDGQDSNLGAGVHPASKGRIRRGLGRLVPQQLVCATRGRERCTHRPGPDPDTLVSFHPFPTDTRQTWPSSVMTSETAVDPTRLFRASEDFSRGPGIIHWTGYNQMFPQTSVHPPAADGYPYPSAYPSPATGRPS